MRIISVSGVLLSICLILACAGAEDVPTLSPTTNPGPDVVPPWQSDNFVARTDIASISVHKVVVSSDVITLIYSIELPHTEAHRTIMVSPAAVL